MPEIRRDYLSSIGNGQPSPSLAASRARTVCARQGMRESHRPGGDEGASMNMSVQTESWPTADGCRFVPVACVRSHGTGLYPTDNRRTNDQGLTTVTGDQASDLELRGSGGGI